MGVIETNPLAPEEARAMDPARVTSLWLIASSLCCSAEGQRFPDCY
jgi:hypothetical protein